MTENEFLFWVAAISLAGLVAIWLIARSLERERNLGSKKGK